MLNWKVRLKNKSFWIGFIPAFLVLIQLVAQLFGFEINLGETGNTLLAIVDTVFVLLGLLGIVVDPTTTGIGDSEQALTYEKPKE